MKGKRTDLSQNVCAASRALEIVGDWWSLLIVREALIGVERFGEFQKRIGLAKNILSSRLKKLVDNGVLRLQPDDDAPARHRYELTEKGRGLAVVITALWQWGEEHCFQPHECVPSLMDGATEQALGKLQLTTADGRVVDPLSLQLRVGKRRKSAEVPS